MKENSRPFFRKTDVFWIFGLILLCAAWYLMTVNADIKNKLYAEIYVDNELVMSIPVYGEDLVFELKGNPNIVFERKNNAVAFITSSCPDKICIHRGYLNKSGQTAVCLPNKVVLKIVDKRGNTQLDAAA